MFTAAVILAGGRGTRSADPSTAKLGQRIGGRSLLQWHVDLLAQSSITELIVVAGYLGDQVKSLAQEIESPDLSLTIIQEQEQKGTVPALTLAAAQSGADTFLVVLGDILMSFPVDLLLSAWSESGKNVAVAVHPSTHPEDSDAVFPSHFGEVIVRAKGELRDSIPNMSSAGLFGITRAGLDTYGNCRDFGSDLLPRAAQHGDLFAWVSSHYFKDTGTPGRLERAQQDWESGAVRRRGGSSPRPALFLDRDGVLNSGSPEFYSADDYQIQPGVAESIQQANLAGIPVIVVTNQPGIAKGLMSFKEHEAIRARLDLLLAQSGAFVDDYRFCPHHPDGGFPGENVELKVTCDCRKPAPGMVLAAGRDHLLDISRSVMVGDSARDQVLAQTTGMHFIHVRSTLSDIDLSDSFDEAHQAIAQGIRLLTC